ncbi:MAG TPA: hypothetical protein VF593_08675 [Chthoniobacteraceae bacterium]|jgi:type IV secretory pathway component VirB8
MIDVLLSIFGPHLAEKLFSPNQHVTPDDLVDAIRELAEEVQTLRAQIERQRKWMWVLAIALVLLAAVAVMHVYPATVTSFPKG